MKIAQDQIQKEKTDSPKKLFLTLHWMRHAEKLPTHCYRAKPLCLKLPGI